MKQYVDYYGEETKKVPLPVAYHLEKGCGRINDTTRDGTICIAMDIKNARSKYFGEPSRLSQMVSTAKINIKFDMCKMIRYKKEPTINAGYRDSIL